MRNQDLVKPQPTLKGYHAWAFEKLVDVLGMSQAEGASYIITRFFQENTESLERDFEISIPEYRAYRKEMRALEELKDKEREREPEQELFADFVRWRRAQADKSTVQ